MLRLNHLVAQTRAVGNIDFELLLALLLLLVEHLFIRVQAGFALCLPSLGSHAHPLQLPLQGLATLRCGLLLLLHAGGFLLQP